MSKVRKQNRINAIKKGFTVEIRFNGKFFSYACPRCFNIEKSGHVSKCKNKCSI